MDNFYVKIVSEGKPHLATALRLFDEKCVGYHVDEARNRLILFKYKSASMMPLPFPMDGDALVEFCWGWLQSANYGNQPDHDGDNHKGFACYCEDWGHVGGDHAAFAAVAPAWAMYGK